MPNEPNPAPYIPADHKIVPIPPSTAWGDTILSSTACQEIPGYEGYFSRETLLSQQLHAARGNSSHMEICLVCEPIFEGFCPLPLYIQASDDFWQDSTIPHFFSNILSPPSANFVLNNQICGPGRIATEVQFEGTPSGWCGLCEDKPPDPDPEICEGCPAELPLDMLNDYPPWQINEDPWEEPPPCEDPSHFLEVIPGPNFEQCFYRCVCDDRQICPLGSSLIPYGVNCTTTDHQTECGTPFTCHICEIPETDTCPDGDYVCSGRPYIDCKGCVAGSAVVWQGGSGGLPLPDDPGAPSPPSALQTPSPPWLPPGLVCPPPHVPPPQLPPAQRVCALSWNNTQVVGTCSGFTFNSQAYWAALSAYQNARASYEFLRAQYEQRLVEFDQAIIAWNALPHPRDQSLLPTWPWGPPPNPPLNAPHWGSFVTTHSVSQPFSTLWGVQNALLACQNTPCPGVFAGSVPNMQQRNTQVQQCLQAQQPPTSMPAIPFPPTSISPSGGGGATGGICPAPAQRHSGNRCNAGDGCGAVCPDCADDIVCGGQPVIGCDNTLGDGTPWSSQDYCKIFEPQPVTAWNSQHRFFRCDTWNAQGLFRFPEGSTGGDDFICGACENDPSRFMSGNVHLIRTEADNAGCQRISCPNTFRHNAATSGHTWMVAGSCNPTCVITGYCPGPVRSAIACNPEFIGGTTCGGWRETCLRGQNVASISPFGASTGGPKYTCCTWGTCDDGDGGTYTCCTNYCCAAPAGCGPHCCGNVWFTNDNQVDSCDGTQIWGRQVQAQWQIIDSDVQANIWSAQRCEVDNARFDIIFNRDNDTRNRGCNEPKTNISSGQAVFLTSDNGSGNTFNPCDCQVERYTVDYEFQGRRFQNVMTEDSRFPQGECLVRLSDNPVRGQNYPSGYAGMRDPRGFARSNGFFRLTPTDSNGTPVNHRDLNGWVWNQQYCRFECTGCDDDAHCYGRPPAVGFIEFIPDQRSTATYEYVGPGKYACGQTGHRFGVHFNDDDGVTPPVSWHSQTSADHFGLPDLFVPRANGGTNLPILSYHEWMTQPVGSPRNDGGNHATDRNFTVRYSWNVPDGTQTFFRRTPFYIDGVVQYRCAVRHRNNPQRDAGPAHHTNMNNAGTARSDGYFIIVPHPSYNSESWSNWWAWDDQNCQFVNNVNGRGTKEQWEATLLQEFQKTSPKKIISYIGDNLSTQNNFSIPDISNLAPLVAGFDTLIIDEAQNIPRLGQSLKILNDQMPDLTVIATGSSSFQLHGQVGEPLVGRKNTVFLYPLSLKEIILHQTEKPSFPLWQEMKEQLLIYGTYPNSVLATNNHERQKFLLEMVDSLLLKDILKFQEIKGSDVILKLLRLLAFQIGSEVSLEGMGKNIGISKNTVARYLDLLEKAYIIFRLSGFSRNLRSEITKMSKYYFYDIGIRNAIINNFNSLEMRDDVGKLWENFALMERIKHQSYHSLFVNNYFWRTWSQSEIDLIEEQDGKLSAFEFKFSSVRHTSPPKEFSNNYKDSSFQVVSPDNILEFLD